jgi:hypothetical protein
MIVRITRVKVGNRQAPQQQTETPPHQGGVSAFTRPESGRMGNGLTKKGAIRRALGATEPDIRKSRKSEIINIRADRVRDQRRSLRKPYKDQQLHVPCEITVRRTSRGAITKSEFISNVGCATNLGHPVAPVDCPLTAGSTHTQKPQVSSR